MSFARSSFCWFVVSSLLLLCHPSVKADAGAWSNIGPAGKKIHAIALDPGNNQVIYVGAGEDGVYKSTNGGSSWVPVNEGLGETPQDRSVRIMQVHPENSNLVYAGVIGGVYRTSNGGTSWSLVTQDMAYVNGMVVGPGQLLYAGTWGLGAFRSDNGGTSWTQVGDTIPNFENSTFMAFALDPTDAGTVYTAVDGAGVFKSTNYGETWTRLDNGFEGETCFFDLVVDPNNPSVLYASSCAGVFKSIDRGASWDFAGTGLPGAAFTLEVDKVAPSTVYAGFPEGGLYRSANGGNTWSQFFPKITTDKDVVALASSFQSPVSLYVGTGEIGDNGVWTITLPDSLNEFYFPQVGNGLIGQLSFQTSLVFVNTGDDTVVDLRFFDSAGVPMAMTLTGLGTQAAFSIPLEKGESIEAKTPGTGALKVGYAIVTAGGGVGGTAVFSYSENGIIMWEAGVPASDVFTDCSIFFDVTGGVRDTGIAIVNTSATAATIRLRLYDKSFALKAEKVLNPNLAGGGHLALYATELFPEIRQQGLQQGVITVESSKALTGVTLRQYRDASKPFPRSVYLMTAFPVVNGRGDR